ncbi:hypothetical protein [Mucilaginibacter flavidus]|uniref:hypothetical protein n=1 Tax=Mucilaginibacter flavidus TaxID=2949309 RepID=UPI002092D867|nr:hypothetical protein [Mucilaginibacter flavidus]MCO5946607.1 hypothetical protein [Mucilaginibacter flavidus]
MKSLKFNFSHPVNGIVKLLNLVNPGQSRAMPLTTIADDSANISVDGLPVGRWKACIEWEHDGRTFFYEEVFEV